MTDSRSAGPPAETSINIFTACVAHRRTSATQWSRNLYDGSTNSAMPTVNATRYIYHNATLATITPDQNRLPQQLSQRCSASRGYSKISRRWIRAHRDPPGGTRPGRILRLLERGIEAASRKGRSRCAARGSRARGPEKLMLRMLRYIPGNDLAAAGR